MFLSLIFLTLLESVVSMIVRSPSVFSCQEVLLEVIYFVFNTSSQVSDVLLVITGVETV